ncbi:MAG: hypothetical protein LBT29_08510 [Flavobacteriaceae bacterium]|jgi:hypothetical protein|nr:hypothetical protein [Flavobacteriaceae bacterium]
MKRYSKTVWFLLSIAFVALASCDKTYDETFVNSGSPNVVKFESAGDNVYLEPGDTPVYEFYASTLRNVSGDQPVELVFDAEQSTAVLGEDFEIVNNHATIPNGKFKADVPFSIKLIGDKAITEGKTVIFTIKSELKPAIFSNPFTLNLVLYCAPSEYLEGWGEIDSEFFEETWDQEVVVDEDAKTITLKEPYVGGYDLVFTYNDKFVISGPVQPIGYVHPSYGMISAEPQSGSIADPCGRKINLKLKFTVTAGSFGTFEEVITNIEK